MTEPKCTVPPAGWTCTRKAGHDGPCAAIATPHPLDAAARDELAPDAATPGGDAPTLTERQRNVLVASADALTSLAAFAAGRSPYPSREDARLDAAVGAAELRRAFPDLFPTEAPNAAR